MDSDSPPVVLSVTPPQMKRPLIEATTNELAGWLTGRGEARYRARQVMHWAFQQRAQAFEQMTDLPKSLRSALDDEWTVFSTRVAHRGVATDGTDKLLLACDDGRAIECVLMA